MRVSPVIIGALTLALAGCDAQSATTWDSGTSSPATVAQQLGTPAPDPAAEPAAVWDPRGVLLGPGPKCLYNAGLPGAEAGIFPAIYNSCKTGDMAYLPLDDIDLCNPYLAETSDSFSVICFLDSKQAVKRRLSVEEKLRTHGSP